jgi:predicted nuclease of predicted toxin-antitoxin system
VKGYFFDENVSLPLRFIPKLPVVHATSLGQSPKDQDLWDYASSHALVIVSKDTDFSDRAMMSSPPPWVVHLRIGNLRRTEFEKFLASVWPQVEQLLPAHKLIRDFADRIESVRG